jgi:hypothetical protein
MLGVSTWQLAVDYESSTGVLDRAAMVEAVNAGCDRVNLRDIQAPEKKQRDKLLERISDGSAADKLATPVGSVLTAAGTLAGGLGLLTQPDAVKNNALLIFAVACLAVAFILTLIPQIIRKTITVKPARLDLIRKQAKATLLKRVVPLVTLLLCVVGLVCAIASVVIGGDGSSQNAAIGEPDATETAQGIAVSLTVKWTNLGTDVTKVRTIVVTLPGRDEVYKRAPKKDTPSATEITQEVKFTLQDPATIEITTEALDATGNTVGEKEQREASVP